MLDRLSEETGFMLDYSGLREMTEAIGIQNNHYLYKKVLQQITKKKDTEFVGLRAFQLNQIAKFLGYKSFQELESSLNNSLAPQLASFEGAYYCYVRANHSEGWIFRSPVRIVIKEKKLVFELKGPAINYKGESSSRGGCLFILMTSAEGKAFHHVYKIGERHRPYVLQGVFSGVSTAFDPIGGRTVLVRQENTFDTLTNRRSKISVMKKSKSEEDRAVASYLSEYNKNNLSIAKSASFGIEDLKNDRAKN